MEPLVAGARADASAADVGVLRALVAAPGETRLSAVAERVAGAVAEAEPAGERSRWSERFRELIAAQRFLPSVPILANAGRSGHMAACYVLEPRDSLRSIYATLVEAALIQQAAGGCGIGFSRLRPAGSRIRRSGGRTPGPLAFIELFAHSARINRRAGRRPGAHLAILDVSHPDVEAFVRASGESSPALDGMGFALGVSDAFLAAARGGARFELAHSREAPRGAVRADALLHSIAEAILETGQPSLLFLDAIEAANPVPHLGPLRATNPCGEQPLLPGESCVLGSLQLPAFASDDGRLDWDALGAAARDAVRFLDDALEVASFPGARFERASLRTRKVGLGFMGLADLALLRGLPFADARTRALAREITRFLRDRADECSRALASERGPHPAWRGEGTARRNASVLAIAPTGTLSLLARCSGGVEPFLAPFRRFELEGRRMCARDRWLETWVAQRAADSAGLMRALEDGLPCAELPGVTAAECELLRRADEVDAVAQIELQAAVQSAVDGAVSKTVHLPEKTRAADVVGLVRHARLCGCKGVAFYRVTKRAAS